METPGRCQLAAPAVARVNPKTKGAKMSAFKFGLALALMLPFIGFLCRVAVELFLYGYHAL